MQYEKDWIYSFIYNSNRIEDIHYPLSVTKQIIEDWLVETNEYEKALYEKQYKEVVEHYKATMFVLETFKGQRPKFTDILEIHRILMKGQLLPDDCGTLRTVQVWVGQHMPPAPGQHLMSEVEKFARYLDSLEEDIQSGIGNIDSIYKSIYEVHCKFEALHPFRDGNGRSGRLLWLALLNYYGFEFNEISFNDRSIYYRSLEQRQISYKDAKEEESDANFGRWYPPRPYLIKITGNAASFI
jgi:Fic family protein